MTQNSNSTSRPIHPASLWKQVLIGGGISLALIIFFLCGVPTANPSWGKYWMIRPLLIVPLSGAGGGLFFYCMNYFLGYKGGWKKMVAILVGVIGYFIFIWLGTIVGLDGTLWD